MAFRTSETTVGGRKVITLHDDAAGSSASILPSFGFNLFDLRLPLAGKVRPVLVSAADFAENPSNPARNGTPILFPYPNRVRGGKFAFGGKTYSLPVTLGPNAIHGFAMDTPWDVAEHGSNDREAFITGHWNLSMNAAASREMWPTDATLTVRYALSGRKLTMTVTVSNPTDRPLPFGFGIHPYFRLPFEKGGDLAKTRVILPCSEFWELEEFLPTGERKSVDARLDFRKGQAMTGLKLDDVLTGLTHVGGTATARLVDDNLNAEFRLTFDKNFRELVCYTPAGDGDVISLEPYTQTTDAINLQPKGIDAGLRVLDHGARAVLTIGMETVG
ncbi:MAG: aldose 1-epimerase [Isosphaeraceae bacterium]|nr:aldose 1-epimerase [Isosphaeraceae bacterium]